MMTIHKDATYGQKYSPAMEITSQEVADAYFEECVQHQMSWGYPRAEAERIERSNLGYYAGYYSHETRQRVERLFHCEHPILGSAGAHPPDAREVFEKAYAMGRASRFGPPAGGG